MPTPTLTAVTAAVALALTVGVMRSPPPAESAPSPAAVGLAGCAAAACHGASPARFGADGTPERWRCSAAQWYAADPHRHAYAALTGGTAKAIMARYAGGRPATQEPRCLACHTNPALAAADAPPEAVRLRAEGVGCEGCHGNAAGWVGPHTTWTKDARAAESARHRMARLADLGERALTCAGCHVGAPADPAAGRPVARDMNHDMIAAGHPRLAFDFADALNRLPKHWDEEAPPADFHARAWLVGRVAQAEAACRLTAHRAAAADLWPEFAEFACGSCHRPIGSAPVGRGAGVPRWQPLWPAAELADLRSLLDRLEHTRPAAGPVGDAARDAAVALGRKRVELAASPDARAEVNRLLKRLTTDRLAAFDRDEAGPVFHALAAVARADRTTDPAFGRLLGRLRQPPDGLRFDLPLEAVADLAGLLKRLP